MLANGDSALVVGSLALEGSAVHALRGCFKRIADLVHGGHIWIFLANLIDFLGDGAAVLSEEALEDILDRVDYAANRIDFVAETAYSIMVSSRLTVNLE